MLNRIITMARPGSDERWCIDALLQYARLHGTINPVTDRVRDTATIADTRKALHAKHQHRFICTAVSDQTLAPTVRLPENSRAYLERIVAYRAERPYYVPLILVGKYFDDLKPGAYQSLEEAAQLCQPDIVVVAARYANTDFRTGVLPKAAALFSRPTLYREDRRLIACKTTRVPVMDRTEKSGGRLYTQRTQTSQRMLFASLPESFRAELGGSSDSAASAQR